LQRGKHIDVAQFLNLRAGNLHGSSRDEFLLLYAISHDDYGIEILHIGLQRNKQFGPGSDCDVLTLESEERDCEYVFLRGFDREGAPFVGSRTLGCPLHNDIRPDDGGSCLIQHGARYAS